MTDFSFYAFLDNVWSIYLVLPISCLVILIASITYFIVKNKKRRIGDLFFIEYIFVKAIFALCVNLLMYVSKEFGEKKYYNYIDNPFARSPSGLLEYLTVISLVFTIGYLVYLIIKFKKNNTILQLLLSIISTLLITLVFEYLVYIVLPAIIPIVVFIGVWKLFLNGNKQKGSYIITSSSTPEDLVRHGVAVDLYQAKNILNRKYGK